MPNQEHRIFYRPLTILLLGICVLFACETVVTYELPVNDTKLVVEGSIENGGAPLVILSRSFPFFGDVNFNDINQLLVKGAIVTVSSSNRSVELLEYDRDRLTALSDDEFALIEPALEQFIGFDIDSSTIEFLPDITFYTVSPEDVDFLGSPGESYALDIEITEHEVLGSLNVNAVTSIPQPVVLDSLWVEAHPNEDIDTNLVQLRARFKDPDTLGDFYRVFNRVNGGPFLTATSSVFDDAFINGESIPFTVTKGQTEVDKQEDPDFDVDGYWAPGELAEVKFCVIDRAHYDFWRTVENEKNNLGSPFGSYTILASNFNNDDVVGIWGGYASTISSIIITEVE